MRKLLCAIFGHKWAELYEALEIAVGLIGAPRDFVGLEDDDEIEHCVNLRIGHVKQFQAALAKARGEQ